MAYTIITSTQGISLQDGSKVITLSDLYDMFDALEADPTLANNMKMAILEEYVSATAEVRDSFQETAIFNPEKVMAYIHAMRQWNDIVLREYPQYRASVEAAKE